VYPPRIFWLILTASLTDGSVGAIRITPRMVNIDKIVAASPEGSSFIFGQGTYRLLQLVAKDKDVFRAEPGTILSGAVLITNYIRAGNLWMVPNQRQRGQVHGVCDGQHPLCAHPEDLYFDDKPLEPVASLSLVKSGKWFFDYSNHTIYFADDPGGHKLEASVARSAFSGNAKDVTIDGFVVEKYAIPAQFGAIGDQYPGPHWIVNHNEVRLNHGRGINVSNDSTVTRNYVHNNGQSGIGTGNSRNVLVQNNEIAFNNYAGFDTGWEAGGFKAAVTTDLEVKDNYVHDNAGPGLWSDIDSSDTRYTGNTVAHNTGS
jgi:hypothetical protein